MIQTTACLIGVLCSAPQMTFYASANVTLWFKKWHTTSAGPYIATLIGLFVLCLLQEALTTYRNAYHARHVKRITRQNDPPVVGGCGCGPDKSEFGIEYVAPQDPPRCISIAVLKTTKFTKQLCLVSSLHGCLSPIDRGILCVSLESALVKEKFAVFRVVSRCGEL